MLAARDAITKIFIGLTKRSGRSEFGVSMAKVRRVWRSRRKKLTGTGSPRVKEEVGREKREEKWGGERRIWNDHHRASYLGSSVSKSESISGTAATRFSRVCQIRATESYRPDEEGENSEDPLLADEREKAGRGADVGDPWRNRSERIRDDFDEQFPPRHPPFVLAAPLFRDARANDDEFALCPNLDE
ncbi:hypothetical protein KM043_010832 [Ampulex compressa]|nr:hypothetical protein KM043_010832 [Ampulex compressa]